MNKCDCYTTETRITNFVGNPDYRFPAIFGICNGTKEREVCTCKGDPTKCDFYSEVKKRALKEIEPKFGEWISVKDRLPVEEKRNFYGRNETNLVLCTDSNGTQYVGYCQGGQFYLNGYSSCLPRECTHWQQLPKPPKESEE